jgi:hypothetical protein
MALVPFMDVAVGEVIVGGIFAKQTTPLHVLPDAHSAVAVALLISTALL